MPSRPSATKKSNFIDKVVSPAGIVALLVITVMVSGGIYFYANRATYVKQFASVGKPTPTPSPTPTPKPIPHGKIPFTISGGKTGPQLSSGYIDPYDPAKGTVQVFHISASDTEPITSFTGELLTDHGVQNLVFSLVSGTPTSGEWEARWTVSDTYLYTYDLKLMATSASGSTNPIITLR